MARIPKVQKMSSPRSAGGAVNVVGSNLDQVIDVVNPKDNVPFNKALDFSKGTVQFVEAVAQAGVIALTVKSLKSEDVGGVIYMKITTDGNGITFSSDFTEARNDATGGAAEVLDCWFTVLPDLKVSYSFVLRP